VRLSWSGTVFCWHVGVGKFGSHEAPSRRVGSEVLDRLSFFHHHGCRILCLLRERWTRSSYRRRSKGNKEFEKVVTGDKERVQYEM
jgi:hypothetical protein